MIEHTTYTCTLSAKLTIQRPFWDTLYMRSCIFALVTYWPRFCCVPGLTFKYERSCNISLTTGGCMQLSNVLSPFYHFAYGLSDGVPSVVKMRRRQLHQDSLLHVTTSLISWKGNKKRLSGEVITPMNASSATFMETASYRSNDKHDLVLGVCNSTV
jgi:hypothetical protein